MPNRYLRASYIDSRAINKLSAEGERMFCRLLIHVDDFGRCEADPDLLRGKLFARQLSIVNAKKIEQWVDELARERLLFLYYVEGHPYIQMNKWENGRAKHSKCPNPPTDVNKCLHLFTRENISPDSDTDTDTDTDTDIHNGLLFPSADFSGAWNDWKQHRKKLRKPMTKRAEQLAMTKLAGLSESDAIRWINHAIERGWQGFYDPDAQRTTHNRKDDDYTTGAI